MPAPKIALVCNECGKTWKVSANTQNDPLCPRCGGADWDVKEEK